MYLCVAPSEHPLAPISPQNWSEMQPGCTPTHPLPRPQSGSSPYLGMAAMLIRGHARPIITHHSLQHCDGFNLLVIVLIVKAAGLATFHPHR